MRVPRLLGVEITTSPTFAVRLPKRLTGAESDCSSMPPVPVAVMSVPMVTQAAACAVRQPALAGEENVMLLPEPAASATS